jgi:hypothetical protein
MERLDEHEIFWIDCLRVACPNGVPEPTLARAQALRRLFASQEPERGARDARR